MGPAANPCDDPGDAAALAGHASALVDAVTAAMPGWIERSIAERWRAWTGRDMSPDLADAARVAGQVAQAEVAPTLRALLETDVDHQRTNPLSILRHASRHATAVLTTAGVAPLVRDEQARRLFPEDVYDLGPAAFADLDPTVHEAGQAWGAAKAFVILRRRRGSSAG